MAYEYNTFFQCTKCGRQMTAQEYFQWKAVPQMQQKGNKIMTAKEILLNIVKGAKGDDLERAEVAFSRLAKSQLNTEYGQSGRTCREILNEYREERKKWEDAYSLLKDLLRCNSQ